MGRYALCFVGALLIYFAVFPIIFGSSSARAQAQSFTISGRVTEPPAATGVGIAGVTMLLTLNGNTQMTAMSDSGGNFSFANIAAGSNYDVTPSKPNYNFNPISQGGTNLQFDRTLFFTGAISTTSTIQFASAASSVSESSADMMITVTRTGDTSSVATVDYATSDTAGANNCNVVNGAASSRCDYLTTLGTLHFAAGDTSKTIAIPIIDDIRMEGDESFTITLSNATGATLGAPATATLTINDNDSGSVTTNPIDTAGFFVRQHYVDFLNREPDTSGLAFWTNELTQCGSNQACIDIHRVNVSAAFYLSIEFQQTGYLVE